MRLILTKVLVFTGRDFIDAIQGILPVSKQEMLHLYEISKGSHPDDSQKSLWMDFQPDTGFIQFRENLRNTVLPYLARILQNSPELVS